MAQLLSPIYSDPLKLQNPFAAHSTCSRRTRGAGNIRCQQLWVGGVHGGEHGRGKGDRRVIANAAVNDSLTTEDVADDYSSTSSSPQQPPLEPLLPTKIILPKKKPMKWSTGVEPGEYGGPPTTTKIPKSWGGNQEDPITSSDLIWNKDFMSRMEKLVEEPSDPDSATTPVEEKQPGFLSLSRVMSLDCMETDLSSSLVTPSKPAAKQITQTTKPAGRSTPRWKLAPTRRELDKWDRAAKATTGGSDVLTRDARRRREDPQVLAAQSLEQYLKLKKKLRNLTLGIGGIGLVSAYMSYTPEISLSFGVGLAGSVIYLRMLGNTVDSMAGGARGVMKGAAGQPRLLVPVALVMIFNRWNAIAVPEYGLMHLELIPMLVGFFTYKIATFAQALEEAIFGNRSKQDF